MASIKNIKFVVCFLSFGLFGEIFTSARSKFPDLGILREDKPVDLEKKKIELDKKKLVMEKFKQALRDAAMATVCRLSTDGEISDDLQPGEEYVVEVSVKS